MKKTIGAVVAAFASLAAFADEAAEVQQPEGGGATTNYFMEAVREWVSLNAFAEIQSAYLARGVVVDSHPFSAQFVNGEVNLGDFGHFGGYAWSVTSLSGTGQGAPKRNAYNEVDYNLHYVYDLRFDDDWSLANRVARQWVTLPGYRGNAKTICEWQAGQTFSNPYVTPYWLLRHAAQPEMWNYWDVGLLRSFGIVDSLSLTVKAFGELGNARHFRSQYGAKPGEPDSHYHGGLQSLNLVLRLDYKVTEFLSVYAFVWQFDMVSEDARDATKASCAPEAKRDLTVGGVGLSLSF